MLESMQESLPISVLVVCFLSSFCQPALHA